MPKTVQIPGVGNVQFPDGMSDDDIALAIRRDILHEHMEPPPTFGQRLSELPTTARALGRMAFGLATPPAVGAAKGAASTAGNITRGVLGLPQPKEKPAALTPQGPAEQIGFGGEQIGEFFVPIPGLSALKVAKAPGFLNLGARVLTGAVREGLDIGAKTAAQTGSLREGVEAAPMGAAFGAAGPVIEKFAPFLRRSAEKQYAEVLHPGTRADKYITANKLLTPAGQDLLNRRVMGLTESGLKNRISQNLMASTVELEDAWRQLGPTHQHNLVPILDRLQQDALEAATEQVGPGQIPTPGLGNRRIVDAALYDAYQQAGLDLIERLGPSADEASAFSLRKVRQLLDQFVKKSFSGQEIPAEQMRKQAQRAATDAIRNVLNKENPTIGNVNKEYSFWRNAEDVFENTQLRRVGQRRTLRAIAGGATRIAFTAAGAHAGPVEAISGYVLGGTVGKKLEDIMSSTAWKTVSAVTKNEIARLLASGRGEAAMALAARAVGGIRASGRTPSPPGQAAAPGAAPQAAAGRSSMELQAAPLPARRTPADNFAPLFQKYSNPQTGVDSQLLRTVAVLESSGDPSVVSRKGAVGLMQLLPATAQRYNADPRDPEQSVRAAADVLGFLLQHYGGDRAMALAAYNAGPGRVDLWLNGKASLPAETRAYITKGLRLLGEDRGAAQRF